MLATILPLFTSAVQAFLTTKKTETAQKAGVAPSQVEQIGQALQSYLTQDERLQQQILAEVEKARQHDIATRVTHEPIVNIARGLVRPVITFTAMAWYVYARMNNIPLQPEDYSIIGGILAFWFGLRPFEKSVQRQKS